MSSTLSRAPRRAGESRVVQSDGRVLRVRRAVLEWYAEHGTDVPWRPGEGRPANPYAALVAAVCAQQTPMARVLPLHKRWMDALPTLGAAARASRSEVLRLWGDAGYPRRAVALREAARIAVERHGGSLPRDEEALLALPGVGPFTAAIVRCFGHGEQVAAVDVNVVRVLGRSVLGELEPVASLSGSRAQELAERMLPPGEAARWNPALMDLGAMACRARPRCDACPLAQHCAARPRFERGERAAGPRRQAPYEGSNRQLRGYILRVLREHAASAANGGGGGDGRGATPPSIGVRTLVARLAGTPGERARVRTLLDALASEGLAWRVGGRCGLGEAPVAGSLGGPSAERRASRGGQSAPGRRATLERPRPSG